MSNYLDFWFIDTRHRIRNLVMYFLIFVCFYIFSNIMIYFFINGTYKPIQEYEINVSSPEITITEAKATYVNGYIDGKVKNNSEEELKGKYLKFEFYTPRNVNIGNKYIKIEDLNSQNEVEYEVRFQYQDVEYFKIRLIDEKDIGVATEDELRIEPEFGTASLISTIIIAYFFW